MKFLVLMAETDHFAKWSAADDEARQRAMAAFQAFSDAVEKRGSIVAGEALADPGEARTVRPGGAVTEGPYAETAEQLGGFFLIDVADRDTAVELAGLLPEEYALEVRPVEDVEGG